MTSEAQSRDLLESQKLEAEIAKLHAETVALQHRRWSGATEFFKVFGAIVAAVLGLWAGIAAYRINQLETDLANVRREKALEALSQANAARDRAASAAGIASYLADNGIKTEVFRPVADVRNAPPATHVRYYKATDRVEAARISELARHAGIRAGVPVFENDPSVQRYRYYVLRLPLSP